MSNTKKLMAGVTTSVMALGLSGCGQNQYENTTSMPSEPTEYECDDWEWDDEEGTYYCDDRNSTHYGGYYFLGSMFANKSALRKSSGYSSFQQGRNSVTSPSQSKSYKSGIGSGSKGGYGG